MVGITESEKETLLKQNTDNFQFLYQQQQTLYFKSNAMYLLDDTIGDIRANMLDRQKALVRDCENELLDCEHHLLQLSCFLESLDAIMSFAEIAIEKSFIRPVGRKIIL